MHRSEIPGSGGWEQTHTRTDGWMNYTSVSRADGSVLSTAAAQACRDAAGGESREICRVAAYLAGDTNLIPRAGLGARWRDFCAYVACAPALRF